MTTTNVRPLSAINGDLRDLKSQYKQINMQRRDMKQRICQVERELQSVMQQQAFVELAAVGYGPGDTIAIKPSTDYATSHQGVILNYMAFYQLRLPRVVIKFDDVIPYHGYYAQLTIREFVDCCPTLIFKA